MTLARYVTIVLIIAAIIAVALLVFAVISNCLVNGCHFDLRYFN